MENRSLVTIAEHSKEKILYMLEMAKQFEERPNRHLLDGKVVATLFFEPSTRTRLSFETAANRLGARVIGFSDPKATSSSKGETLKDTIKMVSNYADIIVMRHYLEGAARYASEVTDVPIVNAGDGANQHPSQTMLDLYSIWERKGSFEGLKVGIVGDIAHSRVCGSLIPALKIMGAEVTVIAPGTLIPAAPEVLGADRVSYCLDDVLPELDVVYMLRIQRERLEGAPFPSLREYHQLFGLTRKRERLMKPDAIVCHPGPINRGVEFDSYMADHPERSVILDQVYAGICVRMAALYLLLGGADNGLAS